jgi:hypothetical protein
VTASTPPGTPAFSRGRRLAALARSALAAAPERLTLALVSLAIACGVTVSLAAFRPATVLPLAAALTATGWILGPKGGRDPRSALGGALALGGAALWFLANLRWVAEYLIVRRDPGFLTLSALWLTDHPSTDIPTRGAIAAADGLPNVVAEAHEAWNLNGDMLQPQGAKMLPALAAVGGWIHGESGVLAANLAIGAIGLLAVYVLARRMMGPIAALVPALGLSLTVSHIWLSRANYTEPITMVLLVAALAWAWQGVEERRIFPLIAAGVASGSTLLARVDGPLFAFGVAAGVAVALAVSRAGTLKWRSAAFVSFAGAQAALTLAGNVSLWRWSRAYVERLGSESGDLLRAYAASLGVLVLVAIAAPVVSALRHSTTLRNRPAPATGSGRGEGHGFARLTRTLLPGAMAWSTLLFLLALASRPLWMTAHTAPDDFQVGFVAWVQQSQGLAVDGTRTYAENTITWVSYYLTWPVVLLGFAGFAIAAGRLGRGTAVWAIPLAGLLVPSLLYVVRPAIMPDQSWAIRRLAPSLVVGLLLLAAVAWQEVAARWTRPGLARKVWPRRASIGIAAVIAAAPLTTWISVSQPDGWRLGATSAIWMAEQRGAREQVATLCSYVDGRPVVLIGSASYFGTIRIACDVPVVLSLRTLTPEALEKIAAEFGAEPVVLTRAIEKAPWVETPTGPSFVSTVHLSSSSLSGLPDSQAPDKATWYIGTARPDGTVEFVPGR